MTPATTLDPTERFAHIIDALCRAVAGRSRGNALAGALILLLWHRLRRSAERFARLAVSLRAGAGPLPSAAASVARPECARQEPGQPASEQQARRKREARLLSDGQPDRLPDGLYRGRGWLVRLVPEAAVCAGQLERLLADPDLAAMALASPPMARLLRSLCRMLAVDPSPVPPPPRRRPPAFAAATSAHISAPRDAPDTAPPDTPNPMPQRRRVRLVRPAWRPPW